MHTKSVPPGTVAAGPLLVSDQLLGVSHALLVAPVQ